MSRLVFRCSTQLKVLQPSKRILCYTFQLSRKLQTYVTKHDDLKCLKVTYGRRSNCYFYYWLRDHCRCDACYNSVTSQRRLTVNDIPSGVRPKAAHVNDDVLKVIWEGGHKSEYSLTWLQESSYENYIKRLERRYELWSAKDVADAAIAQVDYDHLLKSEECLAKLVKSLVDYGVGFVEKVPVSVEATESTVKRIGQVQNTLFGGMWEFSDSLDHNDSAYTREGLPAHTDNTYFTEAAGLQVFHCLGHDGAGGETILVDGFKAASLLQKESPDVFGRLTTTNIAAEYIENGQHHVFSGPILRLHPLTGIIEQIRFNSNDRATLILPQDQILRHYEDLSALTDIVNDPELEWRFKLKPGTVLIIDNFRVLHGRTSYTGTRKMCGCYVGRSDFLSKARVLQILDKFDRGYHRSTTRESKENIEMERRI